jgi:hypothetical protein
MQILRYITPGNGAVCLLAALAIWYLLARSKSLLAPLEYAALLTLVALGILIAGVRDYRIFDRAAVVPDMGAPLIREVLHQ